MGLAPQSRWKFVATDMSGFSTSGGGEILNVTNRQYGHHLNAGKTCQFTMNIDNPRAPFILTSNTLIKVYRKTRNTGVWQLLMVGDTIQVEEAASGDIGTVTVTAADPWWRLQRRVIGMGVDSIGRGTGYIDGTVSALKDNCALVMDILNNINSVFWTGIQAGTVGTSTTGYVGPVYAQNAGDLFQQICNTLGGPNFELVPLEPSGLMPGTTIARMNVVGALGQARPNCVFEYGTGKRNVSSYDRLLTKDGLCNQAFSPPQGFPDVSARGDTVVIGQDTASQSAIGLYQDVVQGDLATTALRQELANEYVTVRKQARQQVTFTPTVDNPLDYGVDYTVGDTPIARAYVNHAYRLNGSARIYGVDIAVNDEDAETPTLTLIPS